MAKKTTNAEIELRIIEIYQAIIKGFSYTKIVKYCKQRWGVTSTRTVHEYLNKARERIKEIALPDMIGARQEATARYLDLYEKNYDQERYSNCIRIQERLDKINGLEITNLNMRIDENTDIDEKIKELENELGIKKRKRKN